MSQEDPYPGHWDDYTNLQKAKHEVVGEYLKGWFPKMALGPTANRRLLYIDTHAGKGKFRTGEKGSPLVALTTLLEHTSRSTMLQNAKIDFYFIEAAEANAASLRAELAKHLPLPNNVCAEVVDGDSFQRIEQELAAMEKEGKRMAPAFVFVDPYTFKLPGQLLRKLLSHPKVELFVNVIWRELDMSIRGCLGRPCPPEPGDQDRAPNLFDFDSEPDPDPDPEQERAAAQRRENARAGMAATLDSIFDGDRWRTITADGADRRAEQCAEVYRQMTRARWGTYLRMLDNQRVRYFLLHLTNHPDGRDLMKACMWKVCPHGGFYASKSDNPNQIILLQEEPNLRPLHDWVVQRLSTGPKHWKTLTSDLREELWLPKHLTDVIRSMRKQDEIAADGYSGKFAQTNNPRLSLTHQVQLL